MYAELCAAVLMLSLCEPYHQLYPYTKLTRPAGCYLGWTRSKRSVRILTFVLVPEYPDLGLHVRDPRRQVSEHLLAVRTLAARIPPRQLGLLTLQLLNLQ